MTLGLLDAMDAVPAHCQTIGHRLNEVYAYVNILHRLRNQHDKHYRSEHALNQ